MRSHPLKYTLVVATSSLGTFLFEGVYASTLTKLNTPQMVLLYITTRILLNIYLWWRYGYALKIYGGRLAIPLLYFYIVVGNFPVETRYFYPLIPYMYYIVGVSYLPRYTKDI